jgi:GT2 family glycosyltransferase
MNSAAAKSSVDEQRASMSSGNVSALDFLSLPFVSENAIDRCGEGFTARRPWAFAKFGKHTLTKGWWAFECEQEADVSGVEVRVSTAKAPLLVFPASASQTYRIHLGAAAEYDVALLVSPWPGRRSFRKLRLRRLGFLEEAGFLTRGAMRLMSGDRPLQRILKALGRLASDHPVGVRGAPVAPKLGPEPPSPLAAQGEMPAPRTIEQGGIFAHLIEGDKLHPAAFEIVGEVFASVPGVRAVYADAIEANVITPKPQWDPELAQSSNYVRAPIFFREGADGGASSWERIHTIARTHGAEAIVRIALPLVRRSRSLSRPILPTPSPQLSRFPRVSILIPTKFRVDLLEKCLSGLAKSTSYPNFEVIVVDNGCEDPRLLEVVQTASASISVKRILDTQPFNFPRLNSTGARHSTGEIILLLNDDIEPIEPDWLTRMVATAMRSDVGAVGARLLYPDRSIQHAGVMMGIGGVCGHMWKGKTEAEAALIPQIVYPGTRLAVTAACLAVRREVYDQVGGLDEALPVALNDIDFCLKLHASGLRNIYRGDAVLIHHESQSRGLDDESAKKQRRLTGETQIFLSRWRHLLDADPYGSPAFDLTMESGAVHHALLRE